MIQVFSNFFVFPQNMHHCKPIETLNCEEKDACATQQQGYALGGGFGNLLLWFIIIAVIAWFILWAWRPVAVQRIGPNGQPTGEVDAGKVLIGSIIIALIIVIIIWLIRACCQW
jgi:hypothetical protein